MSLVQLKSFESATFTGVTRRRLLLIAEGFEQRSLSWISALPEQSLFSESVVFRNIPVRESRLDEIVPQVERRTSGDLSVEEYHRFDPIQSERTIQCLLETRLATTEEVVVDVSVMSKLLIVMLFYGLRDFTGTVSCVYTEPVDYAPSREEYEKSRGEASQMMRFPSYGVHDVTRTPVLSSSVMHDRPSAVVAFTSFNEQLIRALLSTLCPAHLYLINGVPPHLTWRERATQEVHEQIVREYERDNPVDENGLLQRRASTLYYTETFEILADLYRRLCYSNRIILAPTGSKMQSVACGLFKVCCPDVHVEYPTPESFFVPGYSSSEVKAIHHLEMAEYSSYLRRLAERERLNG